MLSAFDLRPGRDNAAESEIQVKRHAADLQLRSSSTHLLAGVPGIWVGIRSMLRPWQSLSVMQGIAALMKLWLSPHKIRFEPHNTLLKGLS